MLFLIVIIAGIILLAGLLIYFLVKRKYGRYLYDEDTLASIEDDYQSAMNDLDYSEKTVYQRRSDYASESYKDVAAFNPQGYRSGEKAMRDNMEYQANLQQMKEMERQSDYITQSMAMQMHSQNQQQQQQQINNQFINMP